MFKLVICGGPHDGDCVSIDGFPSCGAVPVARFDNYADAQDWVERSQWKVDCGDFGPGASLAIDEDGLD